MIGDIFKPSESEDIEENLQLPKGLSDILVKRMDNSRDRVLEETGYPNKIFSRPMTADHLRFLWNVHKSLHGYISTLLKYTEFDNEGELSFILLCAEATYQQQRESIPEPIKKLLNLWLEALKGKEGSEQRLGTAIIELNERVAKAIEKSRQENQ